MTFHSGLSGTISVGGNELPIKDWSVNPTMRIAETDNSMSNSFMLREASGGKTAEITFTIDFDHDSNPFATPVGLVIGAKLTNLKAFLNNRTAGTLFWNFPSVVVSATPMNLNHSGTDMTSVRVTCMSDGTFAYPGAITP